MLKILNFRNFSRTTSLLLRQQARSSQEPPIIQQNVENKSEILKKSEKDEKVVKIKKLMKNDKELAQLITLLRSKKKKELENQIIVEGNQLIKEAVQAHMQLDKLIFSDLEKIKDVVNVLGKSSSGIEFLRVPNPDLNFYSVLQTCPGLIGIFKKPTSIPVKPNALNINVIADNVREPQNLGALIRVSNAVAIRKMLLPKGSVDPWDTKAIRGSCGSVFHLPVQSGLFWEELMKNYDRDELVLIADNNVEKYDSNVVIDYDKIPQELLSNKNLTVIIGGETHGISKEALIYAKQREYRVINIPIDNTANSLNVATALGIILFELRRLITN